MKASIRASLALVAMGTCAAASAQSAGTWMLKGGYNHFTTNESSGDITGVPGGRISIGNAGGAFGSVGYMITNNISTELALGVAPKFNIYGAGTVGFAGKLADTKAGPAAMSVQYRFFEPTSAFRPYVGAGVVYTIFSGTKATPAVSALTGVPTTISIGNKWGWAVQAGATYAINDKWFVDASVAPTFVKLKARFSTGQSVNVKGNLLAANVAIGYRF